MLKVLNNMCDRYVLVRVINHRQKSSFELRLSVKIAANLLLLFDKTVD